MICTESRNEGSMIMKKIRNNPGCIPLLSILVLLPFPWYVSLFPAEDFATYPLYTGLDVMMCDAFQYMVVYALCLIIQYLVMENPGRAFLAALSQAAFAGMLVLYPLSKYDWMWMIVQYGFGSTFGNYIMPGLKMGFYLAVILLLAAIIINLAVWLRNLRKRK